MATTENLEKTSEIGTMERLIEAVLDIWERDGASGTSARAISRLAQTPVSGIYHHFGSLEQLFLFAHEQAQRDSERWCAARLAELSGAGLRSVQLSVQDARAADSDRIAGAVSFAAKERAAAAVRESGLPNRTTSMFTELEGEWDEVFDVIRRATEAVGAYGSRVSLVLKADIRPGHSGELDGKVERLEAALERGEAE